jgi:hypothetical protein
MDEGFGPHFFMIFIKPKQIIIDAFTINSGIHNYFSPSKATDFLPQWWKNLPKSIAINKHDMTVDYATMKQCDGFIEQYKNSFIVPLWSDLIIKTYNDGRWQYMFSTEDTPSMQEHREYMTRDVTEFNNIIQLKLPTPWLFVEKTGVKFQLHEPFWNRIHKLNEIRTAPGILNFKDQNAVVNVFLAEKINKEIHMNSGDPLLMFTPLSDKNIKIKSHVVDEGEWKRIHDKTMYVSSFSGFYKKNKIRCPFK